MLAFFDKADLAKKLNGFMSSMAAAASKDGAAGKKTATRSLLYLVRDFVRVLSLNPKDGKIVVHFTGDKAHQIDYVSLNPALCMKRMLDEAEKLVLASGTLEPT